MVYHGTYVTETIAMRPMDALNEMHFVMLSRSAEDDTVHVSCCCDEDWAYTFHMDNTSDYERIKYNIMTAMFECDTIEELLDTLSEVFEDGFADILIQDECDGCCGHGGCFN